MTTRRTDIHSPAAAAFDPQAYRLVGCYDGGCPISRAELAEVRDQLAGDGYRLGNGSNYHCGHCGSAIRYSALLVRDDVREYIYVGAICLDNRFKALTAEEFKRLRETARLNRERANSEERLADAVKRRPILQRLLNNDATVQGNSFLSDVRRKFVEHGRLSDNQIVAVERVFKTDEQRQQWAAQRASLRVAGVEAPEGRVEVVGEVVGCKWHESRFGASWKITVRADAGWSAWLSLPQGLIADGESAESARGRRLRLTATFTRSDRDSAFAFGKRPSKAEFINP